LFATSNGIPPTSGISLIADQASNGPILEALAVRKRDGADFNDLNLDSALCFRALQDGPGRNASARDWVRFARVQHGTREIETTGRIHGRPAIVIHGRRDALVFPNLHSRAYYALNQEQEGRKSRLRYIEVSTGQHFDAFISVALAKSVIPTTPPQFEVQFAPLHYYFVLAMDSMFAHLTEGEALPPSQVVRPTPRGFAPYTTGPGGNVPTLLPPLKSTPGTDRIVFESGELRIPE
jgi:hydroxybutyrate-dimer hydrolase